MPNSTVVTEFLLTRFSDVWEYRFLHAMLFLLAYLGTLVRNFLIVIVTTLDQSLHTPMYFFLRNLPVLDMCYISVTVPKAHVIFLLDNRAISMVRYAAQVFLMVFFAYAELLFLTIMAFDCNVVICQPHHYPVKMNPLFCVHMTLATLLSGVVYAGFYTGNAFWLAFCQSNMIHQLFCDIPSLLKLSCSEILINEILIFVSAIVFAGSWFTFINRSYIHIFFTVLKFPTNVEQGKVFSNCVPHIIVVTILLSSGAAIYMKPTSNSPTSQDLITTVFNSIVPSFLNPIIYSLRNRQIKEALRRIISRRIYMGKS